MSIGGGGGFLGDPCWVCTRVSRSHISFYQWSQWSDLELNRTPQTPWALCELPRQRHKSQDQKKEGVLCTAMDFKAAIGSRPSGRGGRQTGDIPISNHNLCNVGVFRVQSAGHSSLGLPGVIFPLQTPTTTDGYINVDHY